MTREEIAKVLGEQFDCAYVNGKWLDHGNEIDCAPVMDALLDSRMREEELLEDYHKEYARVHELCNEMIVLRAELAGVKDENAKLTRMSKDIYDASGKMEVELSIFRESREKELEQFAYFIVTHAQPVDGDYECGLIIPKFKEGLVAAFLKREGK